jgi:cysteine-S-conjugate beta-lyase
MSFDFDHPPSRLGTHSVKFDLRRAKFGREDVTPLWVADMDFAAPPCVQHALAERAAHPIYGYTLADSGVFEAIIDWQWRRHGWRIEKEWITLLPGVVPGLSWCVQALTAPGDTVLAQPPVYNPIFESIERNGRHVSTNPLIWENNRHHMDWGQLADATALNSRLFMLCNPHNPGGRVWQQAELEALGEHCLRHNLVIVSDEIHADLVFAGHKHRPIASISAELAAQTVTLNSPGKTFNIAGLQTAYAITPNPALRARLHATLHPLFMEGPNLFGLTALKAAYQHGEPWLNALLDYLQGNIELACNEIGTHLPHIGCTPPEATFLLWLDCRALSVPDATLHKLFADAGLGLSPGTQFGSEGSGFMRLNIALPRQQLATVMAQLRVALG